MEKQCKCIISLDLSLPQTITPLVSNMMQNHMNSLNIDNNNNEALVSEIIELCNGIYRQKIKLLEEESSYKSLIKSQEEKIIQKEKIISDL